MTNLGPALRVVERNGERGESASQDVSESFSPLLLLDSTDAGVGRC